MRTSSERMSEIDWQSEYFALSHDYDILIDKYVEAEKKIEELMGIIAQYEKIREEDLS